MEVSEFYHVIDQMELPKVNAYGLTPKAQEDGSEKLYVFKTLYDAKMYNKNRLGGIILKFDYKLYVEKDPESGYWYIETTIPTNKISVFTPGDGTDKFIPFDDYYRDKEETTTEKSKTANKYLKIASRITSYNYNVRGK